MLANQLTNKQLASKQVRGIPTTIINPLNTQETWAVSFDRGYAALVDTHRALWEQLPTEPLEEFELFQTYRNLDPLQGRRTLVRLAQKTGRELHEIVPLVNKWSWDIRCRAYDMFVEEDRQYCIIQRQNEVMGRHADTGRKLFDLAYNRLQDTVELMTPKVALEVMKLAIELEKATALGGYGGAGATQKGVYTQINLNGNPHSALNSVEVIQTEEEKRVGDKDRIEQVIQILQQVGVAPPTGAKTAPVMERGELIDVEPRPTDD